MITNVNFSSIERDLVINYLKRNLGQRKNVPSMILLLQKRPSLITDYLNELDQAIAMFNYYHKGAQLKPLKKEDFLHSKYLSEALGNSKLPRVDETIELLRKKHNQIKARILPLLNQYKFLDTMTPPEKLAAALIVFSYRSVILTTHRRLRQKNVMVGSSLEEMFCLMAMKGNKTKIFKAVKNWITADEDEGFSDNLVKEVRKL